jgi:hypothetical protein
MKVYLAIHFVHCLITGGERGEREGKRQMKKVKSCLGPACFSSLFAAQFRRSGTSDFRAVLLALSLHSRDWITLFLAFKIEQ